MEMKERESMNKDFEMIRHFACQIIKESFDRNLVNAHHYLKKMESHMESIWRKID
jgi:hypothetical protein